MSAVYEGMTEEADRAPEGYDPGPDDTEPPTEPEEPYALGLVDPEELLPRRLAGVSERQRLLAVVGVPIRVAGIAGQPPVQAITWFQEAWTRSNLAVDGEWGPATEAAARACIADGRRI